MGLLRLTSRLRYDTQFSQRAESGAGRDEGITRQPMRDRQSRYAEYSQPATEYTEQARDWHRVYGSNEPDEAPGEGGEPVAVARFVARVNAGETAVLHINLDTEKQTALWIAGVGQKVTLEGRKWGAHTLWNCHEKIGCTERPPDPEDNLEQYGSASQPPTGIADLLLDADVGGMGSTFDGQRQPPRLGWTAEQVAAAAEARAKALERDVERFIATSSKLERSPMRAMYIEAGAMLSMVTPSQLSRIACPIHFTRRQ